MAQGGTGKTVPTMANTIAVAALAESTMPPAPKLMHWKRHCHECIDGQESYTASVPIHP